jgi:hypothetical protein
MPNSNPSPTSFLHAAIKAFPLCVTQWVAIVMSYRLGLAVIAVGTIVMIALMTILVIFAHIVSQERPLTFVFQQSSSPILFYSI